MFEAKPVWKRVVVIMAGVTMNILFAWFLFSFLAVRNGRPVNPVTTVGNVDTTVLPAAAAAARALRAGDRITAINGEPMRSWTDIEQALQHAGADTLALALADGRTLTLPVHADAIEDRMGVAMAIEPFTSPVTGRVLEGRPAARAGMQAGDTIVAVDGGEVAQWGEVLRAIEEGAGRDLRLTVGRPGGRVDLTVRPDSAEVTDSSGTRWVGKIGVEVYRGTSYEKYPSLWAAVLAGGRQTIGASTTIFRTVRGMVSGRVSSRNVGGPIAIGQMAGETARLGLDAFLAFMALISVNLAVLNLLPIPVLDGGQLVFLLAEGALGRPLPLKLRERLTLLGLAVVGTLMALAFWNDIRRLLEAFTR
jgi:regulator of sigma E protease